MRIARTLGLIASLLSVPHALADTLKDEEEVRQLADRIMARAAEGNIVGAFDVMKPYIIIPESELQSGALQSQSQRDLFAARYGKSIGYELIEEKKLGQSLLRLHYIEKTAKHALPWTFYFYRSPAGWVLNSFDWSDQIQGAFRH